MRPAAPGSPSSPPLVTVGVPFFNAQATLREAVRSVFAQTYPRWRLLLVDDGSTDGSLAVARAIQDPRVTVLSDGVNRGLVYRLNQITAAAQGELIARMDADDLMHPERLARQVAHFAAHPATQVLGTATYTIDGAGAPVGRRGGGPFRPTPRSVLEHGLFIHPTVTMRRPWALANPYDPESFRAEDVELWCRLRLEEAARLDEPLYYYRETLPLNLRAYAASCRTQRRILLRYGPAACGTAATLRLLLGRLLSEGVHRLSGPLGYQRRLLARRNLPLSSAERERAERGLTAIRQSRLPESGGAEGAVPAPKA